MSETPVTAPRKEDFNDPFEAVKYLTDEGYSSLNNVFFYKNGGKQWALLKGTKVSYFANVVRGGVRKSIRLGSKGKQSKKQREEREVA